MIPDELRQRIEQTLKADKVVLFMKGTKSFPQCGFSARVVQALKGQGAEFKDVNILTDPALREGLKEYASWPTFPQLYVNGELVGGCDIVVDLEAQGKLGDVVRG